MTTTIEAPYPALFVTVVLPTIEFTNGRTNDGTVTLKRSMLGRVVSYKESTDRETLVLPFLITRQKSLELEAFVESYQSANWRVTIHDGSVWNAQLVGQPVRRDAVARKDNNDLTGKEQIEVTLTLSAIRLN